MKRNFLKTAIMPIMLVAIAGLALTVLAGCGIGHGPYWHGYDNYHGVGSGDDYRNSGSYGATYDPHGRVYHPRIPGYWDGRRGGYCGW